MRGLDGTSRLLGLLFCLWLALAVPNVLYRFSDSVALPNGMILRPAFDFTRYGRDDLFAADGPTRLATGTDMICFDDRYVEVMPLRGGGGLFDALRQGNGPLTGAQRRVAEEALAGGHGCNGYYTGMLGPGLIYDGTKDPFLPPCAWRNLGNPALRHPEWFQRPCGEE